MAVSASQISSQIIAQLRMLDPSASAEVGTPERKIIDAVSQGLADAQVDLEGLSAALDIDSKYGSALDRFFAIFGFARQKATYAKGYIHIGRVSPSNVDIRIPQGTQVRANISDPQGSITSVDFATLYDTILASGTLDVLVPAQALVSGTIGNVGAYDITEVTSADYLGITEVRNEASFYGGSNVESDDAFKVRFKNTVFRNMAGTRDQYLALAIATAYSTKANVVGPQSTYREYIQVPNVADNQIDPEFAAPGYSGGGNGNAGEYTTALSTIPYAKDIWLNTPVFISTGDEVGSFFYREDVDFSFNLSSASKNRGDAYRLYQKYRNVDPNVPDPQASPNKPSITFTRVYDGSNALVDSIRPNDLVLLEYTYLSKASRNDLKANVTNAVDVYVDGVNPRNASTIISRPTLSKGLVVDNPNSVWHIENFRRSGEPERRPDLGNIIVPLYWQPIIDVPTTLVVNGVTYYKGVHYWPIEEVTDIGHTVRSRSGIEFSTHEYGQRPSDKQIIEEFTGPFIVNDSEDGDEPASFEILDYVYDKNVGDLQVSLEASKQVTTDVLAHSATMKYIKCDFAIMYESGYDETATNRSISSDVNRFLRGLYFGSAVQLSDIVQVAHQVPGVDNIRWSSDLPDGPDNARIYVTDVNGRPLCDARLDRTTRGRNLVTPTDPSITPTPPRAEILHLFVTGDPRAGKMILEYLPNPSLNGSIDIADSNGVPKSNTNLMVELQAWGNTLPIGNQFSVVIEDRSGFSAEVPERVFKLTFGATGPREDVINIYASSFTGGPYVIQSDFYIDDNEMASLPASIYESPSGPSDSAPGIIARPKAQNTWLKFD